MPNASSAGVGRRVIAKMLAGAESPDDIRKAMENFPMTEQRRRYEAEQAEKERIKVAHTNEVVYTLVHWLDGEIFRQYPTWEDCLRGGIFTTPELEKPASLRPRDRLSQGWYFYQP